MADAGSAAFRVSGLELGGLFGSLLAGRISDRLIASKPKGGNVGKRVQVCSAIPKALIPALVGRCIGPHTLLSRDSSAGLGYRVRVQECLLFSLAINAAKAGSPQERVRGQQGALSWACLNGALHIRACRACWQHTNAIIQLPVLQLRFRVVRRVAGEQRSSFPGQMVTAARWAWRLFSWRLIHAIIAALTPTLTLICSCPP